MPTVLEGWIPPASLPGSRRGAPRSLAVALLGLLALLAAGCGGGPEEPAPARADEAQAAWRKIDDGWARAVPLTPSLVLEGARAGDALETVVLPSGPGELVVESRGGVERVEVTGASRVVVPLARGGRATVSFAGAPAAVHAPRIVRGESHAAASPGGKVAPRRILLVVIDTLRADQLTPETMPELLEYFAGGARYTRAYSTATWTLPSMASLLTGKHPTELALPDGTLIALAPGEPTIATDLAARGFHAVGISANYTVNHENGFSSGFEVFLVPTVLGHGEWPDAPWVLDRARRVLEWFPDRDLFLYLHLMDPHDPYRDQETAESLAAPSTGTLLDAAAVERMRRAYASEARRVSAVLAEFLRDAGPFERVVVTADHGEEFLEHGGFKHGPTVYPEVSRVPLLARGDGIAGGTFDAPLSLVGLRRFLIGKGGVGFEVGGGVDVVSFVHAAPRFAWAHDAGQAVLFARDLEERSGARSAAPQSGAASATETAAPDPIGEWLRAHHPAIDFVDPAGAARAPLAGEAVGTALRLAKRLRGLHPGRWILLPAGAARLRVELVGVESGGWWWGAARSVELTRAVPSAPSDGAPAARSGVVLDVEAPDPFALIFLPGGVSGATTLSRVERGALAEIAEPPSAPPSYGAVTWPDPGRPAAALEGAEETMRRLRAQGYL